MATKEVIDTAVVCGKEVLAKCGHYRVELGKDKNTDSTLASVMHPLAKFYWFNVCVLMLCLHVHSHRWSCLSPWTQDW